MHHLITNMHTSGFRSQNVCDNEAVGNLHAATDLIICSTDAVGNQHAATDFIKNRS